MSVAVDQWVVVGEVWVDSGTILIADPCYAPTVADQFFDNLDTEPFDGPIVVDTDLGLIVRTMLGDGPYMVEARLTPEGKIAEIRINIE